MIDTLKTRDGYIYAYIEWLVLGADGQMKNNGEYVYIKNMWIHERWRKTLAFKSLARKINNHRYSQQSAFVYWETAKDALGRKILEENERPFVLKHMSKIYNKKDISDKILKGDADVLQSIPMQV